MDKDVIHTHTHARVRAHTHAHTHTQAEYYSALKKKAFLPFTTTWMEREYIMLSEISRIREILNDLTYICNLKKKKSHL